MNRIIISVTNDLVTDQRLLRTCECFNDLGYEILLIGRKMKHSFDIEFPFKTYRFRLLFNKGFLFYAEYNLRLFFKLLTTKKQLLMANDLDTLLPNYMASKINPCPLIYDSHEYFTEVPELIKRPKVRSFWLRLEEFIFPKLKNVITVNRKIADLYEAKYKVKVTAIRNLPKSSKGQKTKFKVPAIKDERIILYQGSLNVGRGIELMIAAMEFLEDHLLILAGDGDICSELKQQVDQSGLQDRVIFLGKLRPEDLAGLTEQADIGLSLEEDLGLNYRFCLPNKVFDYINAGIPILVSDLPLLRELVDSYKVGEYLVERDPKVLASQIEQMISKKKIYLSSLKQAAEALNWDKEKKVFIEFIKNIE